MAANKFFVVTIFVADGATAGNIDNKRKKVVVLCSDGLGGRVVHGRADLLPLLRSNRLRRRHSIEHLRLSIHKDGNSRLGSLLWQFLSRQLNSSKNQN